MKSIWQACYLKRKSLNFDKSKINMILLEKFLLCLEFACFIYFSATGIVMIMSRHRDALNWQHLIQPFLLLLFVESARSTVHDLLNHNNIGAIINSVFMVLTGVPSIHWLLTKKWGTTKETIFIKKDKAEKA
jgi:hypothetical protein